jgi:DNA-binding GntR family transcriptional regulator
MRGLYSTGEDVIYGEHMTQQQEPTSPYSALKRPEHLSLVDIAYNVLLEAIVDQQFEPGAQISIDSLAKQLHMSNTPVREALMRANGEGLVKQKTNHGFVVAAVLTPAEFRDLFDVRHVLEIHAMQSATITSQAVAELRNLIGQMQAATNGAVYGDYKDYLLLDNRFHRVMLGMSGNGFLLKAWEDLHVHLHLTRLYKGIGLSDRKDSFREHLDIAQALENNDLNQAVTLLSQHIRRVEVHAQALSQNSSA